MPTERISILYFSNAVVRGGAEEHILQLLHGLDRQYFRPYLACPSELVSQLGKDIPKDVPITPLMLDSPWHMNAAIKLARTLSGLEINILHSHMFRASLFASPISWLCRIPIILETCHGREAWRTSLVKRNFLIDRFAGCFVDRYIAVSHAAADYLIESKRLPKTKIRVIHNGTDLTKFHPSHSVSPDLKKGLGFADSDIVLLSIGRLEPQKGHRVLLDAMVRVRIEFPQARLVCIGDGSLRDDLERYTGEAGLSESVRFVGFQSDIRDWLALADVSILSSLYEGLPLAAIESLAAERPVVATAVDGTSEVVLDGKTGFTVPAGNSQELAAAVCKTLRDPRAAEGMARAGRRFVMEEFSLPKFIQNTQGFYLEVWKEFANKSEAAAQAAAPELWSNPSDEPDEKH
jgi:glycosyltransferase involved in cell wall biosynthesis